MSLYQINIKANLFYNRATDGIVALAKNEEGIKVFKPALDSCVLLKCLRVKWKQPLAYYFLHSTCSVQSLKNILTLAILKLR